MTQRTINYGNVANDGTGDPLRTAFVKTDDNFDLIWAAGPVGSNITITNNTISTVDTNGDLVLSPDGVGIIQTDNSVVPRADNLYDLGSANLRYRTISTVTGNFTTITAGSASLDTVTTSAVTVANLPGASTAGAGTRSFVTDADSRIWGNIVAAGGANAVPVWTDGTNWYIG